MLNIVEYKYKMFQKLNADFYRWQFRLISSNGSGSTPFIWCNFWFFALNYILFLLPFFTITILHPVWFFSSNWIKIHEFKNILSSDWHTRWKTYFLKVPPQPLRFTEEKANLRKLYELPYHLAHAGKWEELCQSVLGKVLTPKFTVLVWLWIYIKTKRWMCIYSHRESGLAVL